METGDSYTQPSPAFKMPSEASKRLFWTLNGPLESSIQVAPSPYYEPDAVLEPCYRPATDGAPASWHPVSQESLYTPAQRTTSVRIDTFATYEQVWGELNWDQSGAKWAAMANADPDFDPRNLDPDLGIPICPIFVDDHRLTVTTTGDYLTIHEYVSAVHPWLMSKREILLEALNYIEPDGSVKWTSESKLVLATAAGALRVGGEKQWIKRHQKPREHVAFIGPRLSPEENRRRLDERMLAMSRERIRAREEAEAREREMRGGRTE